MADPGGNALYAAVGANIWSDEVGIVAVVGYDWPTQYTDILRSSAINTAGLVEKDEETLRAWTIYELTGFRRYFSRNTEVALLTPSPFRSTPMTLEEGHAYSEAARRVHLRNSPLPSELQPELWQNVTSVHLSPMRPETTIAWIEFLEAKPDIFVSIDVLPYYVNGNFDDPDLLKLLHRTNAFMPSEAEAEAIAPGYNARDFCREIAARGPQIALVKQGDHGLTMYDREQNTFYKIRPYPAIVDDLTGAGDSFCGGFSVGYLKTHDPVMASLYGTVSASFIIEDFGGLHALNVTRPQAEKRLEHLIQLNSLSSSTPPVHGGASPPATAPA
jgi:ribokinase